MKENFQLFEIFLISFFLQNFFKILKIENMLINFAVLPFEFEKLAPLLSKLRNVAQLKASKAAM